MQNHFLDDELMAHERACLADKDAHRKDNCGVCLTVHNTTYDIVNRMFRIAVQENGGQMFDVDLAGSKPVRPKKRSGLTVLLRCR